MEKLMKRLKEVVLLSSGVVVHHFGSKVLDYKNNVEADKIQNEKDLKLDSKLDNIHNDIHELKNIYNDISKKTNNFSEKENVSKEYLNSLNEQVTLAENSGSKILEQIKKAEPNDFNNEIGNKISNMLKNLNEIKEIIEEIKKGSNNKLTSSFNEIYKFLDSLTLLQESAILHILFFMALILTILNILAVLFGNEIIKYFDLENKYPKLGIFFKLRAKFQKYYLLWNIILLIIICVGGIGINLLVLYAT